MMHYSVQTCRANIFNKITDKITDKVIGGDGNDEKPKDKDGKEESKYYKSQTRERSDLFQSTLTDAFIFYATVPMH